MTSTATSKRQRESGGLSYTPESVAEVRNETWSDKLRGWLTSILEPKLSEKLARVSTSQDRCSLPYWNESVQEMSKQLWLLTGIDSADLSSLSGSAVNVKSWFSTTCTFLPNRNWLRTSLPSCNASVVGSTDSENTGLQSRKIRIYPEPELAKVWRWWQAACRYCYNQAIAYMRRHGRTKSKYKLRDLIMNSDLPRWVKDAPCHIKQNAVMEAWEAYGKSPNAKFRSARAPSHTLQFNNSNFSNGRWYPKFTAGLLFTATEEIPDSCRYGTELMRVKDRWYAILPEPVNSQCTLARGVIALDPGVRTFLTGFDGDSFIEFGAGDIGRITRLCQSLDNLSSRMSKVNAKRRRKMRMAALRLRQKIRNLVDECHRKVVSFLTDHYRLIFLPTFESADMVAKAKRKIGSKTARAMLTWAHYRFKEFLKFQAQKKSVTVVEVSEAYTSQTCTKCGHIQSSLGGRKVFQCGVCKHRLPRDWNSSLGIFLRALRDTAFLFRNEQNAIASLLSSNVQQCSA